MGTVNGNPVIVSQPRGSGQILYCGGLLGLEARNNWEAFNDFVINAVELAGLEPNVVVDDELYCQNDWVRVDYLFRDNKVEYVSMLNKAPKAMKVRLMCQGDFEGVFYGSKWTLHPDKTIELPAGYADIHASISTD